MSKNYVPQEIIVKFKSPASARGALSLLPTTLDLDIERASLLNQLDATVLEDANVIGVERWHLNGMSVEDAIAQFSQHAAVEYVQPNYVISQNNFFPNDPSYGNLWGLNNTGQTGGTADADIDAPEAGEIRTGSPNVVIGVIDSGVDYTHPDLDDNMWINPGEIPGNGLDDDGNGFIDDYHGYDFANDDGDPFDDEGHGTHVAGTIAAEGNNGLGITGVTGSAQIMALKFLDEFGFGSTFDAIQAINYAVLMGADLTNNSWGGGGFSIALQDAIATAGAAGQVFVAAAGNSGLDADIFPHYPAAYDLDNIISVAATDDDDQLASFSNFGATSVDLGAPGVSIFSTLPGNNYGFFNGTSMAAPHVTGVAALLLAENPNLTPTELKARLLETTDPIPALEGITVSGGRLNAFNALFVSDAAKIQGTKWHDLDADGHRDASEPGLANWTIYLDNNNNAILDADEKFTLTDADGNYTLSFLAPGTYTVAEVLPPGWEQTSPIGAQTVLVGEGETVVGIDFGNSFTNPASLSGIKWDDRNGNGVREADEPGLKGQIIYLDENQNGQLDDGEQSTVTGKNGEYSFDNLLPGTYAVAQVLETFQRQTFPGTIGNFETGSFTGWETLGDTRIETADFGTGPVEGDYQALLSNDDGVTEGALEAFLELAPGSLDAISTGNVTEGSAIKQTVTVTEGAELSFSWNFLTSEASQTFYNDFGFISITSLEPATLADTNSLLTFSPSSFFQETGFQEFSYTFDKAGTFTIGLGVVDVNDGIVNSGLLIDDVVLMGGSTATAHSHITTVEAGQAIDGLNFGNHGFNGSSGPDCLEGSSGDDVLWGNDGDDKIAGRGGDDLIFGEDGDDKLIGDNGNDTLNGGDGKDKLLGSFGDDLLNGGADRDNLIGGRGKDILNGGDDNDQLDGGGGDDVLNGGLGDDSLKGGLHNDILNGGEGNDRLDGNRGDDLLNGGDGNDNLIGGRGQDFLNGGFGNDKLTGGLDSDIFVLAAGKGTDRIQDFEIGVDFIGLSDGISFDDLTLERKNILLGDERLATFSGAIDVRGLTAADFTVV